VKQQVSERAGEQAKDSLWRRYRRLPIPVFAISLVSLLNDASSEMIYPLLPLFLASTLAASPAAIGTIEGAAESVSGLLKLFSGYWSDRRGRRKGFVVFGYALAGFMRPLLGLATIWQQVLAIRLVDRVGKGIRSAPRDAMIADSARLEERGLAFGFHRAMDHTGAVIGPLLAYLVLKIIADNRDRPSPDDFTMLFLIASVPALFAVLVAAFFVREKRRTNDESAKINTGLPPVKLSLRGFDGNFKRFLVIIALFTLSNSSDAFLLLRASEAGVSSVNIPLLWAGLHISKVLSSLIGGDLSDRFGRKRLIVGGWILYAAVYAGFAFVSTVEGAWVLFLIYGIYFGLTEGAEKALVADLVRPEQRGTAFGLYNLAFSITVFPASLLMGAMWSWLGATRAFLISVCISLVATLLMFTLVQTKNEMRRI
jgi:MFS family permease